jgi:hypothetical protein
MNRQVIIGFVTEGPTDERFLGSLVQRTFEEVAFECSGLIEVLPVRLLEKQRGKFVDVVQKYAHKAHSMGIGVLCVRTDADDRTDQNTFSNKINPAFRAVADLKEEGVCRNLVAIVPVQMTEAWLLSDTELLKAEIGTDLSEQELGIAGDPEGYNDPKETIRAAIRKSRKDAGKRRRQKMNIGELYLPIGQKVPLGRLERLASYRKFKDAVRNAYKKLNYLY